MSLKGTYGVDYSHARPTRDQLTRNRTFTWTTGGKTIEHFTDGGMRFACRYLLDEGRNSGKALHKDEAVALNSWGIPICSNFEYSVGGVVNGYSQGVKDARTALAEITEMGIPRKVVYFSADVDIAISQIPAVLDYGNGAASVLGKENVGFYGEYDLIEAAGKAGFRWGWQCYAWSRGLWSKYATVRQIRNHIFPDFDGDLNLAMADDIGAWSLTQEADDMALTDLVTKEMIGPDVVAAFTAAGSPWSDMKVGRALALAQLRPLEATKAVRDLGAALKGYADADKAGDAADAQARQALSAKVDKILTELDVAAADPAALAAAILQAMPADLARRVVEELGTQLRPA